MSLQVIVAYDVKSHVIGVAGAIPWSIPKDLAFFKCVTDGGVVVMGRATYESIPASKRPLAGRESVVLSGSSDYTPQGVQVCNSEGGLVQYVREAVYTGKRVYIIGGESLYGIAFRTLRELVSAVIVTQVNCPEVLAGSGVDVRRFDPSWLEGFKVSMATGTYIHGDITYNHILWTPAGSGSCAGQRFGCAVETVHKCFKPNEEDQYKALLETIQSRGDTRLTRGMDSQGNRLTTKSVFGVQLRFDLSEGLLPVCTLRKCWPRGAVQEMLWILRGSTDVKELADLGVHVWDANTTRQALDSYGFTERPEYDLGPSYGFNMRHFGSGIDYTDKNAEYTDKGKDQLADLIHGLREDPFSRRHILTLWDPASVSKASLPPCSVLFQFAVSSQKRLSLHVFLRSSDTLLALYSWNIPQYAVLCAIIAHACGLGLGELVVSVSDAHIYSNQEAGLQMLQRAPLPQPLLRIVTPEATEATEPSQYKSEHITIKGYVSHPAISMPMAI